MAIYRGPGGSGDATGDAANEALVAQEAAQNAAASATAAANSATSAATSATNAANSATSSATSAASSATSATSASNSATSAANSATAAQTAETNAETAETNANASAALAQDWATKTSGPVAGGEYSAKYNAQQAATSASNASTSASNAASSASSASSSASSASASASTATTKASEASASASAAATSASNAATSASSASSSASAASTSATNAANSATSASNSASSASTSATNAANSASSASSSATNAASSATSASSSAASASTSASSAATSASNAATSESNTAALYDQFDDRYLGSKTSDPTIDNDGNALLTGALYFNSSTNKLRVYNGSSWQDSSNAGTVTSVDMSVPTGFTISGNPITSSGTLALGFSAGYSLPTTTKQSQWDTAYSWGNHATAGYLTSYTETDPIYTASSWYSTTNNSSNWNTAYSWGNHASAGYLTSGAIGSSVLAYDSNLQSFVNTFTLPITDGTNGQVLRTNGAGVLSFVTPSVVAALDDLTDVVITSPTTNQVLQYNGTNWVNATSSGGSSFPAGTRLAFQQTSAPTGWTKDTTASLDDSIMRIVTGTASSGGSTAFSTFNGQSSVGATTLSTTQIPSHAHQQRAYSTTNKVQGLSWSNNGGANANAVTTNIPTTNNTGGGGSHNHSITTSIKYYDFIIASKD